MEGHFNISITKRVSLENSTDLGRGAAPELKSVEFLSETLLVVEQIDIHTNFTARQMLYLYRSITRKPLSSSASAASPSAGGVAPPVAALCARHLLSYCAAVLQSKEKRPTTPAPEGSSRVTKSLTSQ